MNKQSIFIGFSILLILGCNKNTEPIIALEINPIIAPDVHDPAQLINLNGQILSFASAVEWSKYDTNNNEWILLGDDIYESNSPSWYDGNSLWAPSILKLNNNQLRLYHSAVINEDNHESRIGFADVSGNIDNLTFIPSSDFVIESENYNQPFAIDPSVFIDKDDRHWMVYGSHAKGIYIVELNPQSGLLKDSSDNKTFSDNDQRFTHLANYGGTAFFENNIEAAYVYNHPNNNYYYLFANWEGCCNQLNSTYKIRVGRSDSPTGPYLDKNGLDMADGYGTAFLDSIGDVLGNDRFIGPGHSGIYQHNDGNFYFSHHFYDIEYNGAGSMAVWKLNFINGWPEIDVTHKVSF
jgi:arabinan endo-1,5-alpha-L-arabinosidase